MFHWTEAPARELISHTCLALLREVRTLACLLLVIAETETRGRKEGTSERRGILLLTPNSKHQSAKDNTNASDRVHRYDNSPISINSLHIYEASAIGRFCPVPAASKMARAPALREPIC